MRAATILAITAVLVIPLEGYAQNPSASIYTANRLLPGCRAALSMVDGQGAAEPPKSTQTIDAGMCFGVISAVYRLGYFLDPKSETNMRFCPPTGSTVGQAMRIVLKELDQKPQLLNLDLAMVTAVVLHNFWPCK